MVAKEAARILQDSQLESLFGLVVDLLFDDLTSSKMRKMLKLLDRPEEAMRLADALENIMPSGKNRTAERNFSARGT